MKYRQRSISSNSTLLHALKKMDELDKKLLIVFDGNDDYRGLLSIGDIQRAIINNRSVNTELNEVLRDNIRVARPEDSLQDIKEMMLEYRMELCPVIDSQNKLVDVHYWEDLYGEEVIKPRNQFNLPVVIMAGGFGSRLKPLTNVIPKPLIPIGEKTMLEHIFDRFSKYGCDQFFLSVNYKASLIEFYLNDINIPYKIAYVYENEPLGTAGSLTLLRGEIVNTFFVSNCDILVEQDYSEILSYHRDNQNELTVVSVIKSIPISYGTIETTEDGQLTSINEKPNITFKINSGMYILEPHLLSEIPENTHFHITQLIEIVKNRGGRVGVFPVSEKSWKDIGEWNSYIELIDK